jgi:hypothetical protein
MSLFTRIVSLLSCPLLCAAAESENRPLPGVSLNASGTGFQTETGQPFVPFGVTYYRPGTGWAPQVWKQFDPAATERDFKPADPNRLVTAGLIQWSVPSLLGAVSHYSGFRPSKVAPPLDFLEIHFYPLANGFYSYSSPEAEAKNLACLEGVVREVAAAGKPVVLGEFGWYGGGRLTIDQGRHPPATEQQQADWCRKAVEVSEGFGTGWLNWGFYDQPEATDVSQLTGLLTAEGKVKAWGTEFGRLARAYNGKRIAPRTLNRPALDWDSCLTDTVAGDKFRAAYFRAEESQ